MEFNDVANGQAMKDLRDELEQMFRELLERGLEEFQEAWPECITTIHSSRNK